MVIDVHAHYVPPALLVAAAGGLCDGAVRARTTGGRWQVEIAGTPPTRPLPPPLIDTDVRLRELDTRGVDVQIVATWTDLFAYHLAPDVGVEWCRILNDTLATAVADHPRLLPLAALPLQDPRAAAEVLASAPTAGFVGAMIGTQVDGRELDHPSFDPVWAAAARLGLPLFVHPLFSNDARLDDYGLVNAVGRGCDTTIAGARLLFGGVTIRHPGLKLVLAHAGGALPYVLGRLRRNHALHPEQTANPDDGFPALYFDSVVFDAAALEFLCRCATPGHVLCGSDYPFTIGDPDPVRVVKAAALDEETRDDVLGGSATRLFNLAARN